MQLDINSAITSKLIDLQIEVQLLKNSEPNLSRPSAVQELWDKIRVLQKKIAHLENADTADASMHFRNRLDLPTACPIFITEPKPIPSQPQKAASPINPKQNLPIAPPPPPPIPPVKQNLLPPPPPPPIPPVKQNLLPPPPPPPIPPVKQQLIEKEGYTWGQIFGAGIFAAAAVGVTYVLIKNLSVSPEPPAPPNPKPEPAPTQMPSSPPSPPPKKKPTTRVITDKGRPHVFGF